MAFNVNSFLAELNRKGTARASNFEVIFTPPVEADTRSLTMRAESVNFPGRGISAGEMKIYGPTFKIGMDSTFNDLNISFVSSEGLKEYEVFTRWQDKIVGNYRNAQTADSIAKQFRVGYYDDYISDITINHYNEKGVLTYAVKAVNAFPLNIEDIAMDWNSQELIKFKATFTYRYIMDIPVVVQQSQ